MRSRQENRRDGLAPREAQPAPSSLGRIRLAFPGSQPHPHSCSTALSRVTRTSVPPRLLPARSRCHAHRYPASSITDRCPGGATACEIGSGCLRPRAACARVLARRPGIMDVNERPPKRMREREKDHAYASRRTFDYTLAWRAIAWNRKQTAARDLAALPTWEARLRRRDGLPPPETPGSVACIERIGLQDDSFYMDLLPGGKRIVTANEFSRLRASAIKECAVLWETAGKDKNSVSEHSTPLMAVLGDKAVAFAAGDEQGEIGEDRVSTWNVDTGDQLCEIIVDGNGAGVSALSAINTRQFVVGCVCGDIIFYEHEQGTKLTEAVRFVEKDTHDRHAENTHPDRSVAAFAMCRNNLASLSLFGEVTIWNLQTRAYMAVLSQDDTGGANSVDMNESVLVTASHGAPHVRVYSVANNYSCIGATGAVDWVHNSVAISARILGGSHVMSTSEDGTLAISALYSDEVVTRIALDMPGARIAAVLPDGSIAVFTERSREGDLRVGGKIFPAPPAAASLLKAYGELTG